MKNVLFLCIGNACRSIMAEAAARHCWPQASEIASAGIAALGEVPSHTLEVLREAGISCEGLYSKDITELDATRFDVIVNLTDLSIEQFIPKLFRGRVIDSAVQDPFGRSLEAYRRTRDQIARLVCEELPSRLE